MIKVRITPLQTTLYILQNIYIYVKGESSHVFFLLISMTIWNGGYQHVTGYNIG